MKSITNKFVHTLVLGVFGYGCWWSWAVLSFAPKVKHADWSLAVFTTLCFSLRPLVIALPVLAAIYCLWVWFRKAERVPSWIGFFAVAMGVLVLVTLPVMVAAYLPLLQAVNHLPAK